MNFDKMWDKAEAVSDFIGIIVIFAFMCLLFPFEMRRVIKKANTKGVER